MAAIKNVCHRCRHTWRLKGEHLSSSCPKCGSQYVGPARAGGIGLFGLLFLVAAGLGAAVWFGLIDTKDLAVPELPGGLSPGTGEKTEPAQATPPAEAPTKATKAGEPAAPPKKEKTADEKALAALSLAENYAENGKLDLALEKLAEAEGLKPGPEVAEKLAAARARIEAKSGG